MLHQQRWCLLQFLGRTFTNSQRCLQSPQTNGYTINPAKCEWAVTETDWLGHWLTPQGTKPWKKKINGILAVAEQKTLKQL